MNRLRLRPWGLIGVLFCGGCLFPLPEPRSAPKRPEARGSGRKEGRDAARAQARAPATGWEVRLPDLSPVDPRKEGAGATAELETTTGASGWRLLPPNLHPEASVSAGQRQASGWRLRPPNLDRRAGPGDEKGRAMGWEVEPPGLALEEKEEARAPEGAQARGAAVSSLLVQTTPGGLGHRGSSLLEVLFLLYNNVANGGIGLGIGALDHLDFLFFVGGGAVGEGGLILGLTVRFPILKGMLKPFAQLSLLGGYADSIEGFGSFMAGMGLQVDFTRSVGLVFGLDFGFIFGEMRRGFEDKFLFALSAGPQFRF
jgi:hypothetical protein